MPLEIIDYRGMDAETQKRKIKEFEQADRRRGFDFRKPPLLRVSLLRLSDEKYKLVWTTHHIILDGWSVPVLIGEILQIYDRLVQGREAPELPEDRYEDFIRYIGSRDKAAEEDFWRTSLPGLKKGCLLPFITPSLSTRGVSEFREKTLLLDQRDTARLNSFSNNHHLTVNTVLQGVWAYLLFRYTGNTGIVFGVTVSGRPADLPGIEKRVGLFMNTIPLYIEMDEQLSPIHWLRRIQEKQLRASEYQYASLIDVQRWAGIPGDLFDSMMTFQNFPVEAVWTSGDRQLQITDMDVLEQTTNYPIGIRVITGSTTAIQVIYKEQLLDGSNIDEIRRHFKSVLLQFLEGDVPTLRDLDNGAGGNAPVHHPPLIDNEDLFDFNPISLTIE
jgi:hypothetical protein